MFYLLVSRMAVIDKEDWKGLLGLFSNAKQVVSSVQDVAQKLADYAKINTNSKESLGKPLDFYFIISLA